MRDLLSRYSKKLLPGRRSTLYTRFLRIRNTLRRFVRKIWHKGREGITLLFIPHSEHRAKGFRVSYLSLALMSVLMLVILLVSMMLINRQQAEDARIRNLSEMARNSRNILEYLDDRMHYSGQVFSRFLRQFRLTVGSLGGYSAQKMIADEAQGGSMQALLPADMSDMDDLDEIAEIDDMRIENSFAARMRGFSLMTSNMNKLTEKLGGATKLIRHEKEVLEYVPSLWPIDGKGRIVSGFGPRRSPVTGLEEMHPGIDILWWPGSPIQAAASGVVEAAHEMGGYGLCILLRHKHGFVTRYAHLQAFQVNEGDEVKRGQIIGIMGSTGLSIAPHLHFEVLIEKQPIDPEPFLGSRWKYTDNLGAMD